MLPRNRDRIRLAKIFQSILAGFFVFTLCFVSSDVFAQKKTPDVDLKTRDPFIALVTQDGRLLKLEKRSSGQLELEGIIFDQQGVSYAVVNREIVGIGDWVGEYQIYIIEKEKVLLLKQGEEITLELKKEEGE